MRRTVVVGVVMLSVGALPVGAQSKQETPREAKSAFTQTFAIPSKGLIRKSEKEALLRRMNHPEATKEKKEKKKSESKPGRR